VTVGPCSILAHAWNLSTAQRVLFPACSNLQATSATLMKSDLHSFFVVAWCIHPDLIPREKIIFILEPRAAIEWGLPMFVDPEEVNYHSQSTLQYRVEVDMLEVEDWHVPSNSS
jgi:hypothetical protein